MRIWIRNPLAILADGGDGGLVVVNGVVAEKLSAGAAECSCGEAMQSNYPLLRGEPGAGAQ